MYTHVVILLLLKLEKGHDKKKSPMKFIHRGRGLVNNYLKDSIKSKIPFVMRVALLDLLKKSPFVWIATDK